MVATTKEGAWDERTIDARTDDLIDALLLTWPVPAGHRGQVVDPQAKAGDWIEFKLLIRAGLVQPGTVLLMNHGQYRGTTATVTDDGYLEIGGVRFDTPSGASKHVMGRASNGWYYWSLPDGRRLRDVRAQFMTMSTNAADVT